MRKAEDAITNLLYLAKEGIVEINYNGIDKDMKNLWTITVDNDSGAHNSKKAIISEANYYEVITILAKGNKGEIPWI